MSGGSSRAPIHSFRATFGEVSLWLTILIMLFCMTWLFPLLLSNRGQHPRKATKSMFPWLIHADHKEDAFLMLMTTTFFSSSVADSVSLARRTWNLSPWGFALRQWQSHTPTRSTNDNVSAAGQLKSPFFFFCYSRGDEKRFFPAAFPHSTQLLYIKSNAGYASAPLSFLKAQVASSVQQHFSHFPLFVTEITGCNLELQSKNLEPESKKKKLMKWNNGSFVISQCSVPIIAAGSLCPLPHAFPV